MTLGEFMDNLLAMKESVERDQMSIENMRFLLVSGTLGVSVELTTHLVYASDDEIRARFVKDLNWSINVMNNEFAARWN